MLVRYMMLKKIKQIKYLLLTLLILASILFYKNTLGYFFISDDFYFLSFKNLWDALTFKPLFYHYNPFFWFTIWLVKSLFGLNPFLFHSFTVGIHLFNVILIYVLGYRLFRNYKLSFLVSLVFSFFFSHYEVVYWVTGLNTSIMISFYLLGFLSFIHFILSTKTTYYILFNLFLILAVFTHEYAISLPLVCFFYWFIFRKNNKNILGSIKLFFTPLVIIFGLSLYKIHSTNIDLFVHPPSLFRFLQSFIKSYLYLFLPVPYLIDSLPKVLLIPFFIILSLFIIIKSYSSKLNLFLFLWGFSTITLFSITSLPQARYFYLSAVPVILLTISILSKAKNRKFIFIYVLISVLGGIFFLSSQKRYWEKSSDITKKTLLTIKSVLSKSVEKRTLYFVNLPDSTNGPPWNAYVFRNGLDSVLALNERETFIIKYFRTFSNDNIVRDDPLISETELKSLKAQGELIFIYNKKEEGVNVY